jgi:hypothetical protein
MAKQLSKPLSKQIVLTKIGNPTPTNPLSMVIECKCGTGSLNHRYILFLTENKYNCNCRIKHIAYSEKQSTDSAYMLCLITRQAHFYDIHHYTITLNKNTIRPCVSADAFAVYREKQISKLLKLYNKLRLILHSDIIRHVIAIMMKHACI